MRESVSHGTCQWFLVGRQEPDTILVLLSVRTREFEPVPCGTDFYHRLGWFGGLGDISFQNVMKRRLHPQRVVRHVVFQGALERMTKDMTASAPTTMKIIVVARIVLAMKVGRCETLPARPQQCVLDGHTLLHTA